MTNENKDKIIDRVIDFLHNKPLKSDMRIAAALIEELKLVKNYSIPAVISWVAVSDKLPTVEDNGQKVLIYRIVNDSQSSLAISIYETNMVKYCNPNETWWMSLPDKPVL